MVARLVGELWQQYLREGGHDFDQGRIGISRNTWVELAYIDHISRIPA